MKATCCLPPLFLYTKQKAIIGTEISKFTRNSAHPKCSSSVHRIHCYYTIKRLVEPLRALSSKGCPPHAPRWRKQKLPLRASHSPCQTERNHFSCDLLLRLEAQDTKTLPFFLVCIADIGDRDSKKKKQFGQRNPFTGKHAMVCSILKFHRKQNMHTFLLQLLLPQSRNFQNFALLFNPPVITLFMDTAEIMLSTEIVSSCKAHNHEAEIRMKESTLHIYIMKFLRKAYAIILLYTTEFSWT